ncbi:MAG: hypothetical protein LBJ61_09330 [Deltaproteobacteria bacterium]|nr:hypothetical protein [Deltaproteobacteria bacterium]
MAIGLASFIATAALFAFPSAGPLAAQEKWPWEGAISIWHSDALFQNQGYTLYAFTADAFWTSSWHTIEDLVITTDRGEITFVDAMNGSHGGRYGEGEMESQEDFDEIVILKATCKSDGKLYDVTDIIEIRDFKPLKIRKR